jgi:hypothetical protein
MMVPILYNYFDNLAPKNKYSVMSSNSSVSNKLSSSDHVSNYSPIQKYIIKKRNGTNEMHYKYDRKSKFLVGVIIGIGGFKNTLLPNKNKSKFFERFGAKLWMA